MVLEARADDISAVERAAGAACSVAVIIPHFEDVGRLRKCLEALAPSAAPDGVEIVVVDNASRVDLSGLRDAFPWVRFLTETARGAAAARNRGVAETGAPMIFFLDCDCVPAPDWLATGRAALRDADCVGGRVTVFDETPPPRSGAQAYETVFAFDQKSYVERRGFSVSANLLVWRRVFEAVGEFAAGVSEDMDWCWRARDAGFRLVYAPQVMVEHPTRTTSAALTAKMRRIQREMFALARRRRWARLRWSVRAVAMVASIAVDGPRLLLSPRLGGAGERWRGLGELVRVRLVRSFWTARQALGLPI
jgi:GT2 family glycosyltransferase